MLEMKDIEKGFFGTTVLRGINFGVKRGEVHVLLGENGAGKSTLMKILSGVYQADAGEIMLDGNKVSITEPSQSIELGIGMVYQELSIIRDMSIIENVWLGHMPTIGAGLLDKKKAKKLTQKMFDDLGIDIDINDKASKYDLGVQQIVEIVRVTNQNAKLIILDEPTSSLSDAEVVKLFDIIRRLKAKGVAFVYITHKLSEVFEIGDRITVIRDGSTIGETIDSPNDVTEEQLVKMMVGRSLDEQYPKEYNMTNEALLTVDELSDGKHFNEVSFSVNKGEVLGVAGLVGSGRSNMAKAIYGLGKITDGCITLAGKQYVPKNPRYAIKQGIGLITKDRKDGLLLHMPVYVNIGVSKIGGFADRLGFRHKKEEREEAKKYIELLHIATTDEMKKVRDLSGGNQQKVAVAKWRCNDTNVFIMDDPTRGVDVGAKVEIYKLINSITAGGGCVLLISSDMPELLGISDKIMVMRNGRSVAVLNTKECTQEIILEKAAGSK